MPSGSDSLPVSRLRIRRRMLWGLLEGISVCGGQWPGGAADRRLEAPNDHPQTASLGRADHGRRAARATVPVRNKGMAVLGHCPIADRASGAAIGGPIGGEQAERETPGTGIAHRKGVCPRGAGPAHDFDGGQPSSEEPIQIGGQPIVIGERARTSDNETKHTNTPTIQVGGEPPQSGGRRQLDRGLNAKGHHSQGREAPKGTLDGEGLLCFRSPYPRSGKSFHQPARASGEAGEHGTQARRGAAGPPMAGTAEKAQGPATRSESGAFTDTGRNNGAGRPEGGPGPTRAPHQRGRE